MNLGKIGKKDPTLHDGLPVRLPRAPKQVLLGLGRDWGMDTPFGGGKVFGEGVNLSPRRGDEPATRLPRGLFTRGGGNGTPHGMVFFGGSLIFAQGTGLYTTADGLTIHSLGTVSDTDKSFVIFGDRLYIYPDKLCMDRGGMPRPLELDTGVIPEAEFSGNTLRLPAGYSWSVLGFEAGDCLRVVSADDDTPAPEGYYRIQKLHAGVATMAQSFPSTYTSDARFLRVVPDLTKCCVSGDRIYGIAGRKIHVSAAGSATDFYSRSVGDGRHAVTLQSDTEGDFIALSPWQGYVVFFKADRVCKLLGSRADSFVLQDRQGVGVPEALANTLCEVGDALYYATEGSVRRYRGQETEWVCALDGKAATGGCGGTDGRGYYLSVTADGARGMSLYLPDGGKWYPEDDPAVGAMLCHGGRLWMQTETGMILRTSSEGRRDGEISSEELLSGPVKASMTLLPDRPEAPARVRLTALWLRATGKTGSLKVYAAYADGAAGVDADSSEEVLLGEFSAPMTDRRLTVPVLAGLCDAVTVRVETVGEWVIHDILRRYEVSEP